MNTREIAAEYRLSHWAQIMQRRIDTGQSIKAYCEEAGIHVNSYYYWQKKLRDAICEGMPKAKAAKSSEGIAAGGFAEVRLLGEQTAKETTKSQNQVCIELQGVQITAGCGYPEEKLAYLMQACMSEGRR